MDFFEQQRKTRRQSHWVLLNFVLVMIGIAALIHVVSTVAGVRSGEPLDFRHVTDHAKLIIATIWLTIMLGGYFRWLDVRGGGSRLAKRFGAEPIEPSSRFEPDRRYRQVVAEMAVAASVPEPSTWVLRNESSINAFVVGGGSAEKGNLDIAIVVSQGALELLDREELQGIVAHEFGHIVHGDLPVNMRLLIVLGGLMAVDEVGRTLTGREPDQLFHPGVVVGFILRALGSVGVFAGSLIRAAFSRRREFLADASAVQFTRDKYGLASALDQIRDLYDQAGLRSAYANELAHLCFHVGWGKGVMRRAFSTHPTLSDRIDVIEPYFSVKQRKKQSLGKGQEKTTAGTPTMQTSPTQSVPVIAGVDDLGASGLSDRFELIVSDSMSSLAMLFALFVSQDPDRRMQYFSAIGFAYSQTFSDKVRSVAEQLGSELETHPIQAIELVSPRLSAIQPINRRLLLLNLEKLVDVEGESNLKNYATLQLLRRKLESDFPVLEQVVGDTTFRASQRKVKRIEEMSGELSLLLSLIVEASGSNLSRLDRDYRRVLKCYTNQYLPRRSASEDGVVAELKEAFQTLYIQPLSQREAFVRHCAEIIQFDGRVVSDETMLLDLFAASLEVPAAVAA